MLKQDQSKTQSEALKKQCSRCRENKSLNFFWKNKATNDGHQYICILCSREIKRSEKYKEYNKNYLKSEKGKAASEKYRKSEKGIKAMSEYKKTESFRSSKSAAVRKYYFSEKGQAKIKKWKSSLTRDQKYNWELRHKYGITIEDYKKIKLEQNDKCKICGMHESENKLSKLYVDHDHKTKKVRGLLCHSCNVGLGSFKDNLEIMKKAIQYLDQKQVAL